MTKILICGGSGFIGLNLTENFSKKKDHLITSTYHSNKKKFKLIKLNERINLIKADFKSFSKCLNLTKNKDEVFICSAVTSGAKDIQNNPFIHLYDNILININLIRACHKNKVKKNILY